MTRLLESLNLTKYCAQFEKTEVDGAILVNCKSVEDVTQLGISLPAKARVLFNEITKRKEFEVQDCICYRNQFLYLRTHMLSMKHNMCVHNIADRMYMMISSYNLPYLI